MSEEVGAAEAEVGRYVYSLIEARMDARPGTPEATELEYLAAIVADVEEYGADELTVDELRAAPASPVLTRAWRPIETAPKDGTRVDLWRDGERLIDCWFHERRGVWAREHGYPVTIRLLLTPPTHWMPAASAPADHATKAGAPS